MEAQSQHLVDHTGVTGGALQNSIDGFIKVLQQFGYFIVGDIQVRMHDGLEISADGSDLYRCVALRDSSDGGVYSTGRAIEV